LQNSLSQKKRKSLRRCLRKIENGNGFRLTHFPEDSQDPERQIEILLALWQARWGRRPENLLDSYRIILRRCADSNSLWLATLWHKKNPVAATAGFVDRQKGVFFDYIGGWDSEFSYLSPGKTMNAYSIRYAIENGFHTYDFLRGAEYYKYSSFGAIDRFNVNITIQRRSFKSALKKLRKPLGCLKGISEKLITHRVRQKLCSD